LLNESNSELRKEYKRVNIKFLGLLFSN